MIKKKKGHITKEHTVRDIKVQDTVKETSNEQQVKKILKHKKLQQKLRPKE